MKRIVPLSISLVPHLLLMSPGGCSAVADILLRAMETRECVADLRVTDTATGEPVTGAQVEFAQVCFSEIAETAETGIGEYLDARGKSIGATDENGEVRAPVVVRVEVTRSYGGAFDPTRAGDIWVVRIRSQGIDDVVCIAPADATEESHLPCGVNYTTFDRQAAEGQSVTVSVSLPPFPGSSVCDTDPSSYTAWWNQ